MVTHAVCRRVTEDDRCFCDFQRVQHRLLGDVRKIHQHSKSVHLQDDIFAESAETVAPGYVGFIDLFELKEYVHILTFYTLTLLHSNLSDVKVGSTIPDKNKYKRNFYLFNPHSPHIDTGGEGVSEFESIYSGNTTLATNYVTECRG